MRRLIRFLVPARIDRAELPRVSAAGVLVIVLTACCVFVGLGVAVTQQRLASNLRSEVERGLATAQGQLAQAERELASLSLTLAGDCADVDMRLTRASLDSSIVRQFMAYDAAADRLCTAMPGVAEEVQATLAEHIEQRQLQAGATGAVAQGSMLALVPIRGLKPGLLAVRFEPQGRVLAAQIELGQFALAFGALGAGESRAFRLSLANGSASRADGATAEQVLVGRRDRQPAWLEARARSPQYPIELTASCSVFSLVYEMLPVAPPALLLALAIGALVVVRWNARLAQRASPERRLRLAVRQRRFEPVIQPIVDARSGRCLGGEVLMRWDHPIRGMVPPAEFVGLAEQTGLIVPMTEILMRRARDRLAPTLRRHPDLYFSFNVTAGQLADPRFADELDALFDEQSLPPRNVVIEMIERDAVDERVSAGLRELRRRGYRIAIDDFGTGQSSLAVLARIECDRLKIDREFVRSIDEQAINRPVLDAIIGLSHRLGLPAIAEGVETTAQRAYLAAQGVAALQGYLIARPMPISDFLQWLDDNEAWADQADAAARSSQPACEPAA